MALVQKRLAPFDELAVHLFNDLGVQRPVAPFGERHGMSQGGLVIPHGRGHALVQGRASHDGGQMAGQLLDQRLVRSLRQQRIERLLDRFAEPVRQAGAQDLAVRHAARAQHHLRAAYQRRQGRIEMSGRDPSLPDIGPVGPARQIALSAQQAPAALHRFVEPEVFEAVQRIVMHEGPHRPVLGDDLA
jgi:hypothetical protein